MMLKKWTRTVALLLAVLFCLSGCSKAEQVDYDTNPLSFETVFDDTPGNPDKPDTIFVETRYNALPAHRVRVYEFEEDTICKGAFYVLPSDYSYDLPEEGITGNDHFMFQDLNNDVIAQHIENWIEETLA